MGFYKFLSKNFKTLLDDRICFDCKDKRNPDLLKFFSVTLCGAATFGLFIGVSSGYVVSKMKLEELREKFMAQNISMSGVQVFADSKERHE